MLGEMPGILLRGSCAAIVISFGLLALPATAQEPALAARLSLVAQPPWHEPGDRLEVRLRVVNDGDETLDGFALQVAGYDRMVSRSDLHASFEGNAGLQRISYRKDIPETLEPGEATNIALNDPVTDYLLPGVASEGGVYPLGIQLYGRDGVELLDSLVTPLVY